jgi:hypothetical protein
MPPGASLEGLNGLTMSNLFSSNDLETIIIKEAIAHQVSSFNLRASFASLTCSATDIIAGDFASVFFKAGAALGAVGQVHIACFVFCAPIKTFCNYRRTLRIAHFYKK